MPDNLEKLLVELERQLDAAPELDDTTRAMLIDARQDIEEALERGRYPLPGIAARLRGMVSRFEAEHPRLTDTVNRLMLSML